MGRAGRVLLVAVIILGIVWFLFVGIVSEHTTKLRKRTGSSSAKFVEHWKSIARERRFDDMQEEDFHVVSKRRIPNGPNPIHNRKAAQSRQQPGRQA